MRRPPDPDETVVLRRQPAPGRRRGFGRIAAALGLGAAAAGLLLLLVLLPAAPPAPPAPERPVPDAVAPAQPVARLASPLAILAHRAEALTVFRLDANDRIVILDFPTLTQQGVMLNRIAALVEKAGLPRDRVLDDAALDAAITASGATVETFYFGHNYRASHLVRFFALAAAQGVALNAEERWLEGLLVALGIARREADGALALVAEAAVVSVPGLQPAAPERGVTFPIDEGVRETILRHELSHGEFFTNPAFAAHVALWWQERMTARDRTMIRRFLELAGYDPGIEEVMKNEAMAFLMHTPDPRFFTPEAAGLEEQQVARLRARFAEGHPETWLKRQVWPSGR